MILKRKLWTCCVCEHSNVMLQNYLWCSLTRPRGHFTFSSLNTTAENSLSISLSSNDNYCWRVNQRHQYCNNVVFFLMNFHCASFSPFKPFKPSSNFSSCCTSTSSVTLLPAANYAVLGILLGYITASKVETSLILKLYSSPKNTILKTKYYDSRAASSVYSLFCHLKYKKNK